MMYMFFTSVCKLMTMTVGRYRIHSYITANIINCLKVLVSRSSILLSPIFLYSVLLFQNAENSLQAAEVQRWTQNNWRSQ